MKILGIETSADETAAAVVEDGHRLLSNVIATSIDLHIFYGGIVPEIAARSHLEVIIPTIDQALREAFVPNANAESRIRNSRFSIPNSDDLWSSIDAIAVTYGPGLSGSLLIGVMTARTLAIAKHKPLLAINHVQAHTYAAFITSGGQFPISNFQFPKKQPEFPLLALSVSGSHSSLILFKSHKSYLVLGQVLDDAVGEAFDKVAKILGLPYPGGPSIAAAASKGNPNKYQLPKANLTPLMSRSGHKLDDRKYDFSFSGLKTAVLRLAQEETGHDFTFPSSGLPEALSEAQKRDIAASFQRVAIETLVDKLKLAVNEYNPKSIVVAGGVAANSELRSQISDLRLNAIFPDIKLCTDNAAMIATLAYFTKPKTDPSKLTINPSLGL